MELIRGLHNLRERHRNCVLSIGNFDGVHLGHQALLARLHEHAARTGLKPTVMIFEPTPREFFAGGADQGPGRVLSLRDRLAALRDCGVARVLCQRFDRRMAAMPAQQYVDEVLVRRLGVRAVVVGDDFHFGAGRGGDLALLQRCGAAAGFSAEALGTVQVAGQRVSSSALRALLAAGEVEQAAGMLGRPYRLSGRIRRGLQLGRTLGMRTANLHFRRRMALRQGVYAVRARLDDGAFVPGVASFGVRPTLGGTRCLLETHLFDVSGEGYGRLLGVEFVQFMRAEQRFETLDALAAQMQQDGEQARKILKDD